jgi:hypothetical protein
MYLYFLPESREREREREQLPKGNKKEGERRSKFVVAWRIGIADGN